jgi:antitoxin YefM
MAHAVTLENAKDHLEELLDSSPTVIMGHSGQRGVVMSLEEFANMSATELESWQETLHLLSNPANAKHLLESVAQHKAGLAVQRELTEL